MGKGVFQSARQRIFNRQLRSPAGGRAQLHLALLASILALDIAANATPAQEQPQPLLPQQTVIDPSEQERQLDAQAKGLEARRTELERSLQQAEMQLQQLVLEQDQQRRRLQQELSDIRERLRDVNNQLADLPRQRLRAKYLAASQTLEQAREKRQQAENQAEAARLAEQDASIAVERLRQLLRQMPPLQPEAVREEQPREKRTERIEQEPQEQRKPDPRREQELSGSLPALQEPLRAVQPQGRAAGETREKQGNPETRRDRLGQQLESLRGEIRCTGEQIKAVTAQMDTTRESLNREISVVRTDLQRMGQTLGRIEQERLEAQGNLKASVEKLQGHIVQVQQLCQTQRALDLALLQANRSTVGSAAYR